MAGADQTYLFLVDVERLRLRLDAEKMISPLREQFPALVNDNAYTECRRWQLLAEIANKNGNPISTPLAVKALIKDGARTDAANDDGDTPLHIAAFRGLTSVVENLVNNGANTEAKNKQGFSPLQVAARSGSYAVVRLLLKKPGADKEEAIVSLLSEPSRLVESKNDPIQIERDAAELWKQVNAVLAEAAEFASRAARMLKDIKEKPWVALMVADPKPDLWLRASFRSVEYWNEASADISRELRSADSFLKRVLCIFGLENIYGRLSGTDFDLVVRKVAA